MFCCFFLFLFLTLTFNFEPQHVFRELLRLLAVQRDREYPRGDKDGCVLRPHSHLHNWDHLSHVFKTDYPRQRGLDHDTESGGGESTDRPQEIL